MFQAFEVVTEFEYCIHRSFYKFEAYKQEMIQTADSFVSMSLTRRESLAEFGLRFITDDAVNQLTTVQS